MTGSSNAALYAETGASPTDFHLGDLTSTQWTNTLDLTHPFNVGFAEPRGPRGRGGIPDRLSTN